MALSKHFPDVFSRFFSENERLGRFYSLTPPTSPVLPGETFSLGLTLFGEAAKDAFAVMQAISQLGEIGLGDARGRFEIISARVAGDNSGDFFNKVDGLKHWPQAILAKHWLDRVCGDVNTLEVNLSTPLRIKEENQLFLNPISFEMLVRRLHGRLAQLSEVTNTECPIGHVQVLKQQEQAKQISLVKSDLHKQDFRRRSALNKQLMTVTGITGRMTYQGDFAPFAGLLGLGSIMQLGGKTAFGFGCLEISYLYKD